MIEKPELLSNAVLSGCLLVCLIGCLSVLGWEWLQSKLHARPPSPYVPARQSNDRAMLALVSALVLAGFVVLITPFVFYFCVGFGGVWLMCRAMGRYRTKRRNRRVKRHSRNGHGLPQQTAMSAVRSRGRNPDHQPIWKRPMA